MFEFLEQLRNKPERTRKKIAFLSAFCVALCILLVWITVIYPDWHTSQSQQAKAQTSLPSPLSTFGSTIGAGFSAIGQQFGALKNSVSSIATPKPAHYEATTTDDASTTTEQ